MADLTQNLPLELLTEILRRVPVPDVLRFKRVNRAFHNAILFSPLIQHKIDLHSTGLEYNAAAGVSLADSRKALLRYRASLDWSCPSDKWTVENIGTTEVFHRSAGGVFAILEDSVRLLTLGSSSRGIPFEEWEIPLPVGRVDNYCFHPGADVIAFFDVDQSSSNFPFEIRLRTLSGGNPHPAAEYPTIQHWTHTDTLGYIRSVSISGSRLVVLADVWWNAPTTQSITIWDWKSGRVLLELSGRRYETVEFLDDYRLLATLQPMTDPLPSLVVIDTNEDVGGIHMRTILHLSPRSSRFGSLFQILEPGAYSPPPPDSSATFHHDPTQRIIALRDRSNHLIFQVRTLLKLAESRRGSAIRWDEWKNDVVVLPLGFGLVDAWVSGCRFFCVYEGEDTQDATVTVYDFSAQKLAKYLREYADWGLDTSRGSSERDDRYRAGRPLPNGAGAKVPWRGLGGQHIGNDCYVFTRRDRKEDGTGEQPALHIWAFS